MMLSNNNFKTFNFLRTLLIQPLTFSFSKRFMFSGTALAIALKYSPLISRHSLKKHTALYYKLLQDYKLNKDNNIFFINKKGIITSNYKILIPQNQHELFKDIKEPVKTKLVYSKELNDKYLETYYNLSGIYQAPPKFYTDINNEYYFSTIITKLTYALFGASPLKSIDDIIERLCNFLTKDNITNNPMYYPLAQHIITSVCPYISFKIDHLNKITEHLVDYSAYQNYPITSQNFIEAFVFKNNHADFVKKHKANLKVVAQNPDNLESDIKQYASLSYNMTKQPHADLRFNFFKIETQTNKIFFRDVKLINEPLIHLPLVRGYSSLVTQISPQNTAILDKRFVGDLNGAITQDKTLTDKQRDVMENYAKEFKNILNKKNTPQVKSQNIEDLKEIMTLDKNVPKFTPSIIRETKNTNIDFEKIMQSHPEMSLKFKNMFEKGEIDEFLPKTGQKTNVNKWHIKVFKNIEIFPKEMQNDMIENYHKFKLIEHGYL